MYIYVYVHIVVGIQGETVNDVEEEGSSKLLYPWTIAPSLSVTTPAHTLPLTLSLSAYYLSKKKKKNATLTSTANR